MAKRRRFSESELEVIFDRTRGKCHLCHIVLSFGNYGQRGARGAWHVDHSVPLANGGTNHRNNLFAACIACNLDKCTVSSRAARARNGRYRAPLNAMRYAETKRTNAISAGAVGVGLGALIGGPPGALIGGLIGLAIGEEINPDA